MKHHIYVTYEEATGDILCCWEAPTLPEGMKDGEQIPYAIVSIDAIKPVTIQIDADNEIDDIIVKARKEKKVISKWLKDNKKVDTSTLKNKKKIKQAKLKAK